MSTWPATLPDPLLSSYSLQTKDQTARTDMESGSARVRRRSTAAPDQATLRFLMDEAQMAIFRSFWETDFLHGAAWVYMPIKDGFAAGLSSKECRPLSGEFKAVLASDSRWGVEFTVEVRNA